MFARAHVLALAVLIAMLPAHAEDSGQSGNPATAAKRQRIETLLEITGALNIAKLMSASVTRQITNAVKQVRPDIPANALDIVAEEVNGVIAESMVANGGFVDLIVPVYASHFTVEELDALIAFYNTPVGRKTVSVMPQVTQEAIQIGQRWGQSLGPTIVERVKARLSEQGIEL